MSYLWRGQGELQQARVKIMSVIKKEMPSTFSSCEKCGYDNGFHVAFEKEKNGGKVAIKLLCPNCKQVYDLGLQLKRPSG